MADLLARLLKINSGVPFQNIVQFRRMTSRIPQQTEAERDDFLIECFYDAGFIKDLLDNRYSVISGRKGAGKTAIARYLENAPDSYGLDVVHRLSIRSLSLNSKEKREDRVNTLLSFILVRSVQRLIQANVFGDEHRQYWLDFLEQNGLQLVQDYESFVEYRRKETTGFSLKGIVRFFAFGAESKFDDKSEAEYKKGQISNTPHSLFNALQVSVPADKSIIIFIDDISDYLDESKDSDLIEDIGLIKSLLLALDTFNSGLIDAGRKVQFVSLVRNDLFEFMEGSNINKLENSSLELKWNERSFAGILIKRLSCFRDDMEAALADPVEAIRHWFPDDIFAETLKHLNTGRHATNFYAYMTAVSFNRPRDFLKYCYALQKRLSTKHPATIENIDAAEVEYTDYLMKELRDELYLASRIIGFENDTDSLNRLIDILSQKDGFGAGQLRSDLAQYLGVKAGHKKTEIFVHELWRYGVIGFMRKEDRIIQFKYLSTNAPLIVERIKEYIFYLHRGLWWFAQKRRKTRTGSPVETDISRVA